jgi:NAD(P)H-flavin reductase
MIVLLKFDFRESHGQRHRFKKEIDQFAKNYPKRFRVHYTVDKESSGQWKGSVGQITQNMLAEHMPAPLF